MDVGQGPEFILAPDRRCLHVRGDPEELHRAPCEQAQPEQQLERVARHNWIRDGVGAPQDPDGREAVRWWGAAGADRARHAGRCRRRRVSGPGARGKGAVSINAREPASLWDARGRAQGG